MRSTSKYTTLSKVGNDGINEHLLKMTSEAEKIEGYYTPQEAAREFRVAEKTIRNMCERGEIEGAVKIGRQWRVPASWVFSKKAA